MKDMTQDQYDTLRAIRYSYKGAVQVKITPDGSWYAAPSRVEDGDVIAKWTVQGYRVQ